MVDAVVLNETRKSRIIGELSLVPLSYQNPNFLDTGSVVDGALYPELASRFGLKQHVSDVVKTNMPLVYPTIRLLNYSAVSQRAMLTLPNGDLYVLDGNARAFKSSDQGATWVALDTTIGLQATANYVTAMFSTSAYLFATQLTLTFQLGIFMRSVDGVNWTVLSNPDGLTQANYTYTMANNVLFCTLRNNVAGTGMYVSFDNGNTWTLTTGFVSGIWTNPVWNGSVYVVTSSAGNLKGYTSPDGITWTQITFPVAVAKVAALANGRLVATPSIAGLTSYYSIDNGVTWVVGGAFSVSAINTVFSTTTHFFVFTTAGFAWSIDGVAWTNAVAPVGYTAAELNAAARLLGSTLFTMPINTTAPKKTTDAGVTWTLAGPAPFAPATISAVANNISSLAASPNVILMIDDNKPGVILRSVNKGVTWTEVLLPVGFVPAIANALNFITGSGAGTFILGSSTLAGGYIISTDSGVTWSGVKTFPLVGGAWNYKLLISEDMSRCYYATNTGNAYVLNIHYTQDGVNWVTCGSASSGNYVLTALKACYFKGVLYTLLQINNSGALSYMRTMSILQPENALVTVRSNVGSSTVAATVLAANDKVLVQGTLSADGLTTVLSYSYNGTSFKPCNVTISSLWTSLLWTGAFFVATNATSMDVLISYNGVDWEAFDMLPLLEEASIVGAISAVRFWFSADGEAYATISKYTKLLRLSRNTAKRLPAIASPTPGAKYVVRAR